MRLPISMLDTCSVANCQTGLEKIDCKRTVEATYGVRIEPVHMLGIVAANAVVGQLMMLRIFCNSKMYHKCHAHCSS